MFFSCVLSSAMHVIQSNFPEVGGSFSMVQPLLVGGINVIHYVNEWPGKGNYAPLCVSHKCNFECV